MNRWMDRWTDGRMDGWNDRKMGERKEKREMHNDIEKTWSLASTWCVLLLLLCRELSSGDIEKDIKKEKITHVNPEASHFRLPIVCHHLPTVCHHSPLPFCSRLSASETTALNLPGIALIGLGLPGFSAETEWGRLGWHCPWPLSALGWVLAAGRC